MSTETWPYTTLLPDLEQRTPEWHAWREGRHTASAAASLVGAEPEWMTREPGEFGEMMMEHGEFNEPLIVAEMAWGFGIEIAPMCIERAVDPKITASLDGLTTDGESGPEWWELKCPAVGRSSATWQSALNQRVDEHHWWQLTHQALALGVLDGETATQCRFVVAVAGPVKFDPGHVFGVFTEGRPWSIATWTWPIEVFADDAAIIAARWELANAGDHPGSPLHRPGRPVDVSDPDEIARAWIDMKELDGIVNGRLKMLRSHVLHMSEQGLTSDLLSIKESPRKGNIGWERMAREFAAEGVVVDDIKDEFRAESSTVTTMKRNTQTPGKTHV